MQPLSPPSPRAPPTTEIPGHSLPCLFTNNWERPWGLKNRKHDLVNRPGVFERRLLLFVLRTRTIGQSSLLRSAHRATLFRLLSYCSLVLYVTAMCVGFCQSILRFISTRHVKEKRERCSTAPLAKLLYWRAFNLPSWVAAWHGDARKIERTRNW